MDSAVPVKAAERKPWRGYSVASLVFWSLGLFGGYLASQSNCVFGAALLIFSTLCLGLPALIFAIIAIYRHPRVAIALILTGAVLAIATWQIIRAIDSCTCGCGYPG